MSGGKGLTLMATLAIMVGVVLIYGTHDRSEAAVGDDVVIMRCLAMGAPDYRYQVANLSQTSEFELGIQASMIEGEGDDCALAISQILDAGMHTNKMTLDATENALIVTFIK